MSNICKRFMFTGLGVIGVIGLILMVKTGRHRTGKYENAGIYIDKYLKKTILVLAKTIAHVQGVLEHIKMRKS